MTWPEMIFSPFYVTSRSFHEQSPVELGLVTSFCFTWQTLMLLDRIIFHTSPLDHLISLLIQWNNEFSWNRAILTPWCWLLCNTHYSYWLSPDPLCDKEALETVGIFFIMHLSKHTQYTLSQSKTIMFINQRQIFPWASGMARISENTWTQKGNVMPT